MRYEAWKELLEATTPHWVAWDLQGLPKDQHRDLNVTLWVLTAKSNKVSVDTKELSADTKEASVDTKKVSTATKEKCSKVSVDTKEVSFDHVHALSCLPQPSWFQK